MESLVAIVIPTLNEELFIEDCIESIRHQSYPFDRMEIMVVDGGSTDNTKIIVETIAKTWTNIRLLHNPKKIQSAAFNIGVAQSTAPYIIRLDAHAKYNEYYIALCVKHLKENPLVGDAGGVCDVQPRRKGLIPEANAILNRTKFGIGGAAFRVGAKAGYVDTVPFGAFPRHVIDEIGGMREDMPRAEDNEYVTRLKKAGYKVYLDPEIICTYYSRDSFNGLIKQMYANGVSIGQLFYIDRSAIGFRHFTPFAFVCTLIGLCIGTLLFPLSKWLLLFVIGLYSLCALYATIIVCIRNGWRFLFIMPPLFFSVHFAYGCGTIVGLFKYAKKNTE